jgi:hypothetical protein
LEEIGVIDMGIKFYSIEDFAERGPIEGSVWPDSHETIAYEMRVVQRHYESDFTSPTLIEVEMSACEIESQIWFLENEKLWIVVRLTERIAKKFAPQFNESSTNIPFAILPDFFFRIGLTMNSDSPCNRLSIGFSRMTGLNEFLTVNGSVLDEL